MKTIKESENKMQERKQMKRMVKDNIIKLIKITVIITGILIILYYFFPERYTPTINISGRYAKEMISIFPAVLLIMGLADVWVPSSMVKRYLGQEAGFRGKILAVFLGTLPTGPMYVAFPLAAEHLRKKASVSNIIVFLGVWGSLKIPQIGVEIKFLGPKFAFLRLVFTLISVFLIGFIIEKRLEQEIDTG